MSNNNSLLPKEAVALVQHIELNKAGWWDKAVHRIVLAAVWLEGGPASLAAIQKTLETTFRLPLSGQKLSSALTSLVSKNILVCLPNDNYRIPDQQRTIFEGEIAASENAELEAKRTFCRLVAELGDEFDPEKTWVSFDQDFLEPLIKEVGANAYRLVAGEKLAVDRSMADNFLRSFAPKQHQKLQTLVTSFLDPKLPEVCAHVSRVLHARFCVEASGLPENILAKLNDSVGKQIRFRMFVDTNFLFSLLELHENPSNTAAQELRELILQLKTNPHIDLVITPKTIEEAKSSISYTMGQLSGVPMGQNFTQSALHAGMSGMVVRFLTERLRRNGKLTAEEWFEPYLNDFVPIARSKGVELFNENLDSYSLRQDVVDDINVVLKFEEERLPETRRKSYPKVAHDMVLWHFANDKRPAYVESAIDANYWILTVDYRLIGFDEHKQKRSASKVPLCIHPTTLIQLLQFWVPRTKEFEEAMLGSLRLPFLFQEFDAEAERTSLKILKGIGRFEGSEDLSRDAITNVMLNEGLRSRLATNQPDETEVALIRDALVEEVRLQAEAEATKAKELQQEILKRDSELATLTAQKQAAENESAETKKQKAEAEAAARLVLSSQGAELDAVKARLQAMEEAELRRAAKDTEDQARLDKRKALYTYLSWLVLVLSASAISAWQAERLFPWYSKILGLVPTMGLAAIIVFVLGHLILEISICRKPAIALLWPFRQVERFSRVLWTVVLIGFFGGVGGNIYASRIQHNIEAERVTPPAKELSTSEPSVPATPK